MNAPGSSEQGPLQSSVSWVGTGSMIIHGGPCVKDPCNGNTGIPERKWTVVDMERSDSPGECFI